MGFGRNVSSYIKSLSSLEAKNYASANSEVENIYKRLTMGRKAFADIYELDINAVSRISALDLEIKFYTEQLLSISKNIDDDEESDSIVTNEIDSTNLDALFPESGDYENEEARKQITAAEKELVEFINKMKAVAYEKDGKEYVE